MSSSTESLNLGYLVPEFPTQTHNFFWKEIGALRAQGVSVHLFSTKAPESSSSPHPFREQAVRETIYLFPPSVERTLTFVLFHPAQTTKALAYIHSLREASPVEKLRLIALIPSAIELLHWCRQKNLSHVHCHSCANAAHLVTMAKLMGGPSFSLTLHGDLPVYGRDHRSKMADAKFVACVTRPLQNDVLALTGKSPEEVPVIRMGVDTSVFKPLEREGGNPGKLTLLTVARLNPSKGIDHALRAIAQAKQKGLEITYLVAGEGPDRERLEALIKELRLESNVRLLGTTGESEVISLLQHSDAFILPSVGLGEAAPVSVMEAMSCGLPVICSRIGGTPDMISDGIDGFLTPQKDEAAILAAIERLTNDLDLRSRIGRTARVRAEREFDHHAMAARLLHYIVLLKIAQHDTGHPLHRERHSSELQNPRHHDRLPTDTRSRGSRQSTAACHSCRQCLR